MIKVGGKDSVENVGFLNIRGYMTTVWTLKYWNRGLFLVSNLKSFQYVLGLVVSVFLKNFILAILISLVIRFLAILEFVNATCSLEGFEQSVSSPDCVKEGIRQPR